MDRGRPTRMAIGVAAFVALAMAPIARAQDAGQPYYWPHRTFNIPVNVQRINQSDTKPSYLQLYSSINRGKWQAGPKLPLNALQDIGEGKRGFRFTADRDGEFEFSVQYWYASGASSPRSLDELRAMLAITIDTSPPTVRVQASSNGVQWESADDNLDPRSTRLEARFPNWTRWQSVKRAFKTSDNYAWQLKPGQVLEVRVSAKDRAGNEGYSPIVRVPGNNAIGTSFPKGGGGAGDWPPSNTFPRRSDAPRGGGNLPKPRIEYVSGADITVDYTIQRAGRSGVQAAHLYVQKDAGPWQFVQRFGISPVAETGKTLSLKYAADTEGLYGFYVAPESGAGIKADPPQREDQPMLYVVVDKRQPFVKITGVHVVPGGVRGPRVEIAWETADQNLMADPITLEYSVDKGAIEWKEIKYRLPPGTERADSVGQKRYVGTYTWEVPDETLWKFHVRIRAVDKAGNTGKDQWKDEVIVDLEKPAAGITGVRGAPGQPGNSPAPAPSSPADPVERAPKPGSGSSSAPGAGSGPKLPELPGGKPDELPKF